MGFWTWELLLLETNKHLSELELERMSGAAATGSRLVFGAQRVAQRASVSVNMGRPENIDGLRAVVEMESTNL